MSRLDSSKVRHCVHAGDLAKLWSCLGESKESGTGVTYATVDVAGRQLQPHHPIDVVFQKLGPETKFKN